MAPPKDIVTVARNVRKWAMRKRHGLDASPDLEGMCAIASYKLFLSLLAAGHKDVALCVNEEHAFVRCAEWVVDVTATQFSGMKFSNAQFPKKYKPTEVRKLAEHTSEGMWEIEEELKTIGDIQDHFRDWPDEQRPLFNE